MTQTGSALELDRLTKTYDGGRNVLDNLKLDVAPGELVSLLGPSGCGKSTALRIIGGLVPATSGTIRLGGRDITRLPAYDRNIGLVFQNYALFPHMTIAENVAFGLEMRGMDRKEALKRAEAGLERVRLGGLAKRRPRQLSGGQQQRVALARALVVNPALLLLDEPLSNLDAKLREDMRIEIRELQQQSGVTAIFVTHDQAEAMAISDRVAVMDGGRIEQFASPVEIYERPATPFVASFIGRVNALAGQLEPAGPGLVILRLASGDALVAESSLPSGRAVLSLRPNRIALSTFEPAAEPRRNRLAGRLINLTYAGDNVLLNVEAAGQNLNVEAPSRSTDWQALQAGQTVWLHWDASDGFLFPEG